MVMDTMETMDVQKLKARRLRDLHTGPATALALAAEGRGHALRAVGNCPRAGTISSLA
jgi:hypothetical protein